MAKNKKYYETASFKKLKREWDKKLLDDGFVDIEKDNGKLRGTPFVHLTYLNPANPKAGMSPDKQSEASHDIDADIINFHESYRARYYYHAQALASKEAARPFAKPFNVYCYQLHATGMSQRDIAAELGATRAAVRKVLESFSRKVKILVDSE